MDQRLKKLMNVMKIRTRTVKFHLEYIYFSKYCKYVFKQTNTSYYNIIIIIALFFYTQWKNKHVWHIYTHMSKPRTFHEALRTAALVRHSVCGIWKLQIWSVIALNMVEVFMAWLHCTVICVSFSIYRAANQGVTEPSGCANRGISFLSLWPLERNMEPVRREKKSVRLLA